MFPLDVGGLICKTTISVFEREKGPISEVKEEFEKVCPTFKSKDLGYFSSDGFELNDGNLRIGITPSKNLDTGHSWKLHVYTPKF